MKIRRNKFKVSTVALVLVLIITALMAGIAVVTAHDPPMSFETYAYVTASPNPVGVTQQALIYMWLSIVPPTATGIWGDRWEGFELEVTKPDNSTQNLGTYTSDPIGFAWTLYTPDETGTYTFHFSFPGQTLEGKNLAPGQFLGVEFIGDYFEESSAECTLTVQEETIPYYPAAELPIDYWTRPIDAEHREWWSISGNWLTTPANSFARYTEAPETAHILWAEPLTFGGLVGGEFGAHSFHCGNAYEGKWWPPVIIGGILYYNQFPMSMAYDEYFGMYSYYMPGVHAVDLRTGEEIWYNPDMRIDFGQIYHYDSMNQHGAAAYLWQQEATAWVCYDAWTGQWFCNVTNVPPGVGGMFGAPFVFGPDGNIMVPVVDVSNHWLAMWDLNSITDFTGAYDLNSPLNGTAGAMWRPFNKVVDGSKGWVWNVTISTEVQRGGISKILLDEDGNPDRIIGSWLNTTGIAWGAHPIGNLEVWCLSLKEDEEGKLLWNKEIVPPSGANLNVEASSLEGGVFTLWCPETLQHWGYSLDDGSLLWGPTEPQLTWDFLWATGGAIAYGKLFSCGMGGRLYCYNVTTGELQWTYDLESPYYLEAKWGGKYPHCTMRIADEKIYIFTGEHSPDDPKERGTPLACVDIEGNELWSIPFYASHWAANPAIADGILVYLNAYDNRIYAFGKGPSATEVSASPKIIANGASVLIEGQVTDQSPGAEGTPAIADEDMSEWMKYLYMQFPCPMDIHGVDVMLQAKSSNGTIMDLATVTSDGYGCFSYEWTPPYEDQYTIMAIFLGSKSYWASYAQTAVSVGPAPEAPPEPEEEPAYTTIDLAIIAAVVVAIVIGIVNLWALRKRT